MDSPVPITSLKKYQKLEERNLSDSKNSEAPYFSKPAYHELSPTTPASLKNFLPQTEGYSLPVPYPSYLKKPYPTKYGDVIIEENSKLEVIAPPVPPIPVQPVLKTSALLDNSAPPPGPPPVPPSRAPPAPAAKTRVWLTNSFFFSDDLMDKMTDAG
jgi:hypothetical protein